MAVGYPPQPVYPYGIDNDYTLFLVYNTSEAALTVDNEVWSEEVTIVPRANTESEIWADNGFANISGELFYYDSVDKDSNGKVYKLKKCARNLGGVPTQFNKTGTMVRGFVVAEHHNQLANGIILAERFIGYNFTTETDTLDWRIRNLQAVPIIFDDFGCPDVIFSFTVVSSDPSSGTIVDYRLDVVGSFTEFVLSFGDGSSTSSTQQGTHTYAPNANIDPVVTFTNQNCQVVQTPLERDSVDAPEPDIIPNTFQVPNFPNISFPDVIVQSPSIPEQEITFPPFQFPCIDFAPFGISPINIPSIIVFTPEINLPDVISFGEISIPDLTISIEIVGISIPNISVIIPPIPNISVDIPNISVTVPEIIVSVPDISLTVPEIPDISLIIPVMPDISVVVPPIPDIDINVPVFPELSVAIPDITISVTVPPIPDININVPEIPPIDITVPTIPPIDITVPTIPPITITVPTIPPIDINVPAIPDINVNVPAIPDINVIVPAIPNININVPAFPDINVNVPAIPNININVPVIPPITITPPTIPPITVEWGAVPQVDIDWGPVPIVPIDWTSPPDLNVNWGSPPTIPVDWGSPPQVQVQVTVTCPSTPLALAAAEPTGLMDNMLGKDLEVSYDVSGFPSEIRMIPPEIPDVRIIHELPSEITVRMPSFPNFKFEVPEFQDIRILPPDTPLTIEAVGIPESIKLESMFEIPERIELFMPIRLPDRIIIEHDIPDVIRVEGLPDVIRVEHDLPASIRLELPEKPEIELVYKGSPIPVQIQLDIQKLIGDQENLQCVAIVPCARS